MVAKKSNPIEEKKKLLKENQQLKKRIESLSKKVKFSNTIDITKHNDWTPLTIHANPDLKEECTAISLISDVHIEERVLKSIINDINEYNPKIAKQRLEFYFKRLLYLIRSYRKGGKVIEHLVLGIIGDVITGYIHEELLETNFMSPSQASLYAQEILTRGLMMLSESGEFKSIKVVCVPGNHGRTSLRKKFKSAYSNSYEWLMYNQMKNYFTMMNGKYSNINFIISDSEFIYLDIYGKINMFSHGDHFNYQGGIGGIYIPLLKWLLRENKINKIDMAWIGHWHQLISINGARINGSVIGYNEYARSFGFIPEPPQMQFQLLDKRRGYTSNEPIILTDF